MRITFICIDGHGHVNSCIGLAQKLAKYGNICSFIVPFNCLSIVLEYGFQVLTVFAIAYDVDPQAKLNQFMEQRSEAFELGPIEQFEKIRIPRMKMCLEFIRQTNDQYGQHIKTLSPDCIIYFSWMTIPAIVKSGIPYILLYTCNPLLIYGNSRAPPYSSGLSDKDSQTLFAKQRSSFKLALADLTQQLDWYLASEGINPFLEKRIDFMPLSKSPYLNLYIYPETIDYKEFNLPAKWFRVEHCLRTTPPLSDTEHLIPEKYEKLIFVTLGSQVSNTSFLTKLITILSKSKYHFIVTLGSIAADLIQLPKNVVGRKYVNQLSILPKVDLVIHHGGNNTFIESLYFGKPSIIFPMFGDQHDNGRRAVDMGIGKCISPTNLNEKLLLDMIDETISDEKMQQKVSEISLSLQQTQSHERLNKILISIVELSKNLVGIPDQLVNQLVATWNN
ncbi:sterol 3-beta-glucosyltransferase-like [Tetranychus urticae]|uniref:UDP-glycosyltransferase 203C1 n=1 Tax=Tetranychus urticae TaxID=32264 RepID=T1K556_TETUR|nr:sterol 3-beta-glucosyltransferase-like [Tetranychus urticae]AHX56897.1 UDP-glycosyltransferase 203C1 [Tetranychus urticae]